MNKRIHFIYRAICIIALCIWTAQSQVNTPKPPSQLKAELSDLFGGKTARIVWQKDVNGGWPGMPSSLPQPVNKLLKMNSADGTISQFIGTTYGYKCRPTFTWDGQRVVFTDLNSKTLYVASWSTGAVTQLASGYENGGCYYYQNKHWVLATNSSGKIYQIDIDNPGTKNLISCPKNCLWPSMSPDGQYLAGLFPNWGHAGVLNIATGTVREFSNPSGCWPTMFRDNSHYILYTIEPHRNIRVVDPNEKQIFNQPVGEELLPGDSEYNILRGTMDPDIFTFMVCLPGNNPYIARISDRKYVYLNTGKENPNEGNMDIYFEGGTDATNQSPQRGAAIHAATAQRSYDPAGRAVFAPYGSGMRALISCDAAQGRNSLRVEHYRMVFLNQP